MVRQLWCGPPSTKPVTEGLATETPKVTLRDLFQKSDVYGAGRMGYSLLLRRHDRPDGRSTSFPRGPDYDLYTGEQFGIPQQFGIGERTFTAPKPSAHAPADPVPELPVGVGAPLRMLLRRMVRCDPAIRPTAADTVTQLQLWLFGPHPADLIVPVTEEQIEQWLLTKRVTTLFRVSAATAAADPPRNADAGGSAKGGDGNASFDPRGHAGVMRSLFNQYLASATADSIARAFQDLFGNYS